MATRQRGRRPTPDERKVRLHEEAIRAAQEKRLDLERQLERATTDLAQRIDEAIDDSVATNAIGSWITSKEKPQGISRQMVYKLIAQNVDTKTPVKPTTNGKPKPRPAPRKRPGSQ